MALKIRRKKKHQATGYGRDPRSNPMHLAGRERDWRDDERERTQASVNRRMVYIILVCVVILVVLIASTVAVVVSNPSNQDNTVSAQDTFALTSLEQQQITETAKEFATGMLVYQYCQGDDIRMQGKNTALSVMANNTASYSMIQNMDAGFDAIPYDDFIPVIEEPVMTSGTQSYAGTYTYEFDAGAGQRTQENPDGEIVDKGFHFKLEFSQVQDQTTGDYTWVVSSVEITRA